MKHCPKCEIEKPVSEFYLTSHKNPARLCKTCHNERGKTYTPKKKYEASRPSEGATIAEMRRHGIFATSGKASDYHYVDVVAWGCVRIEVKLAMKDGNGYTISFSDDQVRDGIRGDLVAVIIPSQFGDTYYVLPVDCPLFYREGKLLFRVSLTMNSQRDSWRWQLFARYRDAWHQVEEKRQQVIASLGKTEPARIDGKSASDIQQFVLL